MRVLLRAREVEDLAERHRSAKATNPDGGPKQAVSSFEVANDIGRTEAIRLR